MAVRVVFLGVVFILCVAVPAMSHRSPRSYADSWAVEVSGGEAEARELAEKHGFLFRGQVRANP